MVTTGTGVTDLHSNGLPVSTRALDNLKLCVYYLKHMERFQRQPVANEINLALVRIYRDQQRHEEPVINDKDWPSNLATIREYLASRYGVTGVSLEYVVRPDFKVKPEAEYPAEGYEIVDQQITLHAGRRARTRLENANPQEFQTFETLQWMTGSLRSMSIMLSYLIKNHMLRLKNLKCCHVGKGHTGNGNNSGKVYTLKSLTHSIAALTSNIDRSSLADDDDNDDDNDDDDNDNDDDDDVDEDEDEDEDESSEEEEGTSNCSNAAFTRQSKKKKRGGN
jgi:hypothetical protein